MKKRFSAIIQVLVFLGIGILLIWLVVRNLGPDDIEEIKSAFQAANYWWLLVSILLGVLAHLIRAVRWKMMLVPLGYHPRVRVTFYAIMIGYLANLAFPRLGEITRCGILNRYEGIPINKSFGTVIASRVLDLLILISLFIVTLITQFNRLSNYANEKVIDPLYEKFGGYFSGDSNLYLGLGALMLFMLLVFFLRRLFRKFPLYSRVKGTIRGMFEGVKSIGKVENVYLFVVYTIMIWVIYWLMIYLCYYTLPELSGLALKSSLAILVFGSVGLIAVQGGIGAYPVIVMETLGLYGVTLNLGFAFGWIVWTAQTLLVIIVGTICLLLLQLYKKNEKREVNGA